jgi:hypothetical protein
MNPETIELVPHQNHGHARWVTCKDILSKLRAAGLVGTVATLWLACTLNAGSSQSADTDTKAADESDEPTAPGTGDAGTDSCATRSYGEDPCELRELDPKWTLDLEFDIDALVLMQDREVLLGGGAVSEVVDGELVSVETPEGSDFGDLRLSTSGTLIGCYGVGDEGFIARYDGTSWQSQSVGVFPPPDPTMDICEATTCWGGWAGCAVSTDAENDLLSVAVSEYGVDDGSYFDGHFDRESGAVSDTGYVGEGRPNPSELALGWNGKLAALAITYHGIQATGPEAPEGLVDHHLLYREDGFSGSDGVPRLGVWGAAFHGLTASALVWTEVFKGHSLVRQAQLDDEALGAPIDVADLAATVVELRTATTSSGTVVIATVDETENETTITLRAGAATLLVDRFPSAYGRALQWLVVDEADVIHLVTRRPGETSTTHRLFVLE